MKRVIEHAADDMTVTVEAGVRWSDLQNTLAEKHQELPFDTVPAASTVGGAIGRNIAGPISWSAGRWRDRVLGLQAVDGSGRIFRSGGRVVKNVAGYDLSKLMVGSFGTLGAITEVTLKVQPAAPRASMKATFGDLSLVAEIARQVVAGQKTVAALEVVFENDAWTVQACTSGARSVGMLERYASQWSFGDPGEVIPGASRPLAHHSVWSRFEVQLVVPLSRWTSTAAAVAEINGVRVESWLGGPIRVSAHRLDVDSVSRLGEIANAAGGYAICQGISDRPLSAVDATDASAASIMNRLRDVFDPAKRFSTQYAPWLGETAAAN